MAETKKYDINSDFYEDEDYGSFMVLRSVSTPETQSPSRHSPSPSGTQELLASVPEVAEKVEGEESEESKDDSGLNNNDKSVGDSLKEEPNSLGYEQVPSSSGSGSTILENVNTTSMTSDVSSMTSVESQAEDLQTKINQLINDNLGLKDLVTKVNEEMQKNLSIVEKQKLSFAEESKDHQLKFEQCRERINILQEENNALKNSLASTTTNEQNVESSLRVESDFEKLESMESMLSMRDKLIIEQDIKIRELVEALATERHLVESLKEMVNHNEKVLQQNVGSLSQSDEALAKSLSEKEDLERKLETFEKQVEQLEDDRQAKERAISELKQQLEDAKNLCEESKNKTESMLSKHKTEMEDHLKQKESMRMELLARTAEHEQQVALFRHNIEHEVAEKTRLKCELQALQDDHNAVKATMQELTNEITNRNVTAPSTSLPSSSSSEAPFNFNDETTNPPSITAIPGKVYQFFKRGVSHLGSGEGTDPTNGQHQDSFEHIQHMPPSPSNSPLLFPRTDIQPCPICRKKFTNVKKLELHASQCGMDDFDFP